MKLKEYIHNLNELAKKHPEALEYTMVSSLDPDRESFREICHNPTPGHWDEEDQEFASTENMKEEPEFYNDTTINSVCIN